MHFLQLFLPGIAAMSSHVSIPVWLLWHQIVESRSEYEGDTWRGILEGSYRPLARADEREEKGGCRVVVQGVAVSAETVGGANRVLKERYFEGKTKGGGSFCWVFFREERYILPGGDF